MVPMPAPNQARYHAYSRTLSETEFTEFILPHLSMPKRGPRCQRGYHRVFNCVLKFPSLLPPLYRGGLTTT
jgi:hypothetical protein